VIIENKRRFKYGGVKECSSQELCGTGEFHNVRVLNNYKNKIEK
jgi:hypothetical protein